MTQTIVINYVHSISISDPTIVHLYNPFYNPMPMLKPADAKSKIKLSSIYDLLNKKVLKINSLQSSNRLHGSPFKTNRNTNLPAKTEQILV